MILRVVFTVSASGLLPISLLTLNPTSDKKVEADDNGSYDLKLELTELPE